MKALSNREDEAVRLLCAVPLTAIWPIMLDLVRRSWDVLNAWYHNGGADGVAILSPQHAWKPPTLRWLVRPNIAFAKTKESKS